MSEAEYKTLMSAATINAGAGPVPKNSIPGSPHSEFYNEDEFLSIDDIPDLGEELTEEDKVRMAMK